MMLIACNSCHRAMDDKYNPVTIPEVGDGPQLAFFSSREEADKAARDAGWTVETNDDDPKSTEHFCPECKRKVA